MSKKNILITGATGLQGRALIQALQKSKGEPGVGPESESFHVLALTRTASSPAAQDLAAAHPGLVTLVQGDLESAEAIRKIFEDAKAESGGIWGVFCVLAFPGLGANADGVEKQGKIVADMALEYGVSAFVFSSAERGGEYYDDNFELDGRAKVMIERHIRALGEKGLPWTFLRPGFFMENYDGLLGAIAVGVLKYGLKPTTTNRMVAVDDIGDVAAAVFRDPSKYASQILIVSGEVTTMSQQEESYQKATGKQLPSIPKLLARIVIALNAHTKELLADLERKHDARETGKCPEVVDQTAAAKEAHPAMRTLYAWAQQRAGQGAVQKKNWNKLSVFSILTGRQ
ncbi:NAD(P)-binding protein [Mycena latifolia]|nr:NAD(P)-binding protein [Mycena latifolia]